MAGAITAGVLAVAAAGISAYGAKQAAKEMKKLSPAERAQVEMLQEAAKRNRDVYDWLMQFAKDPISQHTRNLNAAAQGDREYLLRQTLPERTDMSQSAQQAVQNMAQMGPRTGAQAAMLNSMPYNLAQQQQQMLSGRKQAAQDQLGPWGVSLASLGTNALNQQQNTSQGLLNFYGGKNRDAWNAGAQTGAGIYNMLNSFIDAYGSYRSGQQQQRQNPTSFWGGTYTPTTGQSTGTYNPNNWGGWG